VSKTASNRTTEAFEAALSSNSAGNEHYVLRLYVTGMTVRSSAAIATLKKLCVKYLQGRYELEVIDIYQHPALAKDAQIIAAPTLVKQLPLPLRRLIGNLSDIDRVLVGLDLRSQGEGLP
jgi:circadian clock protein KaiB